MTDWLTKAKRIQAIAQTGKAYSKDPYDIERFQELHTMAMAMIADLAEQPVSKVENLYIPEVGYPTPKVDLRAGVIKDGKILLVKERTDGRWSLPGGWADVNESPKQGIIREVLEESGYQVENAKLVALKDRDLHPYTPKYAQHMFKLFFVCDFVGGEATENIEVSEIGFFAQDDLPELSVSRVLQQDIDMLFLHHHNPNTPIIVD